LPSKYTGSSTKSRGTLRNELFPQTLRVPSAASFHYAVPRVSLLSCLYAWPLAWNAPRDADFLYDKPATPRRMTQRTPSTRHIQHDDVKYCLSHRW